MILAQKEIQKETQNIVCNVCSAVLGTLSMPTGKSAAIWKTQLTGYICDLPSCEKVISDQQKAAAAAAAADIAKG